MHFTRHTKDTIGDLQSNISIGDTQAELCQKSMRVLGVWVDPKLRWRPHMAQAISKGNSHIAALSRLVASTWGPTVSKARVLYSAVVRPGMMYGSQVWGADAGETTSKSMLNPLEVIQNQAIRKVMGAYKRTPTVLLNTEAGIEPIRMYTKRLAMEYTSKTAGTDAVVKTARLMDQIWDANSTPHGRQRVGPRPPTTLEATAARAAIYQQRGTAIREQRRMQEVRRRQAAGQQTPRTFMTE
jgi:hypothetical protein